MGNDNSTTGNLFLHNSRAMPLPHNVNDKKFRQKMIENWKLQAWKDWHINSHQNTGLPTMDAKRVTVAASHITSWMQKHALQNLVVLEIMAGNCEASFICYSIFRDHVIHWWATDHTRFEIKRAFPESFTFVQCDSVAAVQRLGKSADILLMISPPCSMTIDGTNDVCGFADYYACHDFIQMSIEQAKPKYIIFVGELGASDGTGGMYNYMLNHPRLFLSKRFMIDKGVPSAMGNYEKELFIFQII
jgi:hypothetical protein